jgi:hypothetical protein
MVAEFSAEELSGTLSEDHVIRMLSEGEFVAGNPDSLGDAGIVGSYAKASNNRVVGAGDNTEENWIGMKDHWPARNLLQGRRWNIAKEQIGDIALEDDDLAIA